MAKRKAQPPSNLLDLVSTAEPLQPLRDRLLRAAGVYPWLTLLLAEAVRELDRLRDANAQLRGKGGGDAERNLAGD